MTVRLLLVSGVIALGAATFAAPQPAAAAVNVQAVGPQIGSAVPLFELPDQSGHTRSLQSIMGPKGAVLVFFRSADW